VKTISIKKVAAIAAASIALGGLVSTAPAYASTGQFDVTVGAVQGATSTSATVTGITSGVVAAIYELGAGTTYFSATGATITTVTRTGSGTINATNGATFADGFSVTGATAADTATVTLTSSVAGTGVLTAYSLDGTTGIRTTIGTLTITWTAASALDLGSVKAYVLANGVACSNSITASTVGAMNYALAVGSALNLCVVLKNNSTTAFTRTTSISVVGNGIGQVNGAAVYANTTAAGYLDIPIYGNGLPGTATFNVTASATNGDATVATKTATASVIANGDFTAITLAVAKKSITGVAGGVTTAPIKYSAVDAKGNAAAIDITGAKFYISSDKSTDALTSSAPSNATTTAAAGATETIIAATGAGSGTGAIDLTTTTGAYEKLSIYVTKTNAAGVSVKSNTVEVYVSTTTVKSLVISAVNGTASGSQTVTVTAYADPATTGTGTLYPVVDTEAITLAASAGMLAATTLATGKTGDASTTLFSPQLSGTSTITAAADAVTATKQITISGGGLDATMTAIDALNAKIVALNALIAKIMKKLGIK